MFIIPEAAGQAYTGRETNRSLTGVPEMETTRRAALKAITWQALGLVVMSLLGYLVMGSMAVASGFALLSASVGLVTYFIHERIWATIRWGLRHHPR